VKRFIVVLAALAVALMGFGFGQDYPWRPERPITIIVPWGAGGSTDTVTRVLAAELEAELGQPVVIVNQPGASGSIGTTNALTADNDCYTWAAGAAQDLGTYGVLAMLETSLADWHLYLTVANTAVVGVNADAPYQTFPELVDAMRARPGEIAVATAGQTSAGHNAMELIAQALDLSYRHVTYEGGNPAVIATVGGETEVTTQLAVEQAEMIRAGRIRPLAAVSNASLELDGHGTIPSVSEWIPGINVPANYFGIWIPRGAPEACVQTFDMVWDDVIADNEALQRYANERGALFDPSRGQEAEDRAMVAVRANAWILFDAGKAAVDPSTLGIERP
jgi:tripartite-type tricarboxylate transporter receptor subunit TctC